MLPIIDSENTELKSDLDKQDNECHRSSSKSVPIPCHSQQKGNHDEYFHDEEGREGKGKINQLKAIEASIERHNLKDMLTYLGDDKSTNKADELNLYSTSPISCASSSSESSEEGDEEQKIKRRKNLYELKKKLEIENPVDIPDIVDEIETNKTKDNEKQIINGKLTKGMSI